ncbi:MAG: hypothetical protein JWO11_2048 [Nocardioides sp.]|nr:hypothetical protein [Nocardioides sp.]
MTKRSPTARPAALRKPIAQREQISQRSVDGHWRRYTHRPGARTADGLLGNLSAV